MKPSEPLFGLTPENYERYRQMIDWERTAYLTAIDIENKAKDSKTTVMNAKTKEPKAPIFSAINKIISDAKSDQEASVGALIEIIDDMIQFAKTDMQEMKNFLENGGDAAVDWIMWILKENEKRREFNKTYQGGYAGAPNRKQMIPMPQDIVDYHSKIVQNLNKIKNVIISKDWSDLWQLISSTAGRSGAFKTFKEKHDFQDKDLFYDKLVRCGTDPEYALFLAKQQERTGREKIGELSAYDPKADAPFVIAMDYLTNLNLAKQGLGMSRFSQKQKGLRPGPKEPPKSAIKPEPPKSEPPKFVEEESVEPCPVCESIICRCCSVCHKVICTCEETERERISMISEFIDPC